MEDIQQDASPLSAFPGEHPVPKPSGVKPVYKSKTILIGTLVVLLIVLGSYSGYMYLGKTQTKYMMTKKEVSPAPTTPTAIPTPKPMIANAKTYTNSAYSYKITYDETVPYKTADTAQYGYTEFSNGCAKVYAVPSANVKSIKVETNGIPWDQIDDLKSLSVGDTKNCSVLTFTFAADGHAVVNKNDYQRLKNEAIAGTPWYAYSVKNGANKDVTTDNVYFTEKNNTLYVLEAKNGGSCPATTPADMLTTFSFIP